MLGTGTRRLASSAVIVFGSPQTFQQSPSKRSLYASVPNPARK